MNVHRLCLVATGLAATVAVVAALVPAAHSQVQASPSLVPIGVSSSGSTSTAWFHEPSSRQAFACQTIAQGSGLSAIQCVVAKLPS
jgi:hypothetical protein